MSASVAATQARQAASVNQQPQAEAQREERFNDSRLYERLKLEARKAYHHAYGTINDDQWDAAFNMSYWKLCQAETLTPGVIEHPPSWIATIAKNEIISEYRKNSRQTSLAECGLDEDRETGQDLLNALAQRHVLRDLCFIINLLPSRQKRVWSARFVWDYSPEEIMQLMGLSRKAYEKTLQQATTFLISKLDCARQGVCGTPEMESLVRGYAIWGDKHYSSKRSALARAHLNNCAACRHTAWLIRFSKRAVEQPLIQQATAAKSSDSIESRPLHATSVMPGNRIRLRGRIRSTAARRRRVPAG